MPAPKSKDTKDTKKEQMTKTNRRKGAKPQTKNSKGPVSNTNEGQKPEELLEQLGKNKNRLPMYEILRAPTTHSCDGFLRNLENNPRFRVPMNEKRRWKVAHDQEYLPGQFANMENSEFIFMQAPTKSVMKVFWQGVQHDKCKVMVSLTTDNEMSATDESKCYQYFPTEVNQSIDIEQEKGKLTLLCKSREGLSMGAIKYEMELTDSEKVIDKNSDDPNEANMPRGLQFTLFHMNTWTGVRPESGHPLEQAQNVALFLREVNKAEMVVLRKTLENYVPPVVLQSFNAIGRASIAWAVLMLMKDVEKRECFDFLDLMRKLMKLRPGSFSCYYHFAFAMATALWVAKEVKWCEKDVNEALNDLMTKFPDRKLNEVGNVLPPN